MRVALLKMFKVAPLKLEEINSSTRKQNQRKPSPDLPEFCFNLSIIFRTLVVQKTVFEGHFFLVPSLTEVVEKRQDGFGESEAVFEGQNKHCYNSVITP